MAFWLVPCYFHWCPGVLLVFILQILYLYRCNLIYIGALVLVPFCLLCLFCPLCLLFLDCLDYLDHLDLLDPCGHLDHHDIMITLIILITLIVLRSWEDMWSQGNLIISGFKLFHTHITIHRQTKDWCIESLKSYNTAIICTFPPRGSSSQICTMP